MAISTDAAVKPWLVIFVKEPRPGRVKSRLARDLGTVGAASWYRHHCRRLLRQVGHDRRWTTVLAVTPDREGLESRFWPAEIMKLPQGGGDLGARMAGFMRRLPPGPAAIIGSDIPGIRPSHIIRAFRLLRRHDVVFGPSPDGGYWLVGMRRRRKVSTRAFRNVRWSGEHALADSRNSLPGHAIGHCDTLQDVDTVDDLRPATDATPPDGSFPRYRSPAAWPQSAPDGPTRSAGH